MPSVSRIAVVTHGRTVNVDAALSRLQAVAADAGVELLYDEAEATKHGVAVAEGEPDLAVVLGGDGTMLRALTRFLGTDVPVFGVNFGRVGFLTAAAAGELESAVGSALRGEYRRVELPTLELEVGGQRHVAANDAVVTSGTVGRMIELGHSLGGEDLGVQPCDGLICATPSGSTAYNLSNGGPVLVWGLEAMVITFVAPHSLHSRPLVVGPDTALTVSNQTPDVVAKVLVDGHPVGELASGETVSARLGAQRSLLAMLPGSSFFDRYAAVFGTG
jgi:NAD+ kinase